MKFKEVCAMTERALTGEWDGEGEAAERALHTQKRAMIGYEDEVRRIKERIGALLRERGVSPEDDETSRACADSREASDGENPSKFEVPPWYASAEDAIFHEVWGLAGMAEWFGPEYAESSSAKIIGERIYYLDRGVMRLMPQTMDSDRREQLVRALLLLSPEERLDREFHEIYMLDGTRVTIFRGGLTKKESDVIIFRRYVVPVYTFEEQSARGTIPREAVPLFKDMVRSGFNVVFCGSVRSAKTTFLSTWQSCEDPALEGVMVETDPEIPLHRLMPKAPVVQLLADGEKLSNISKNLMRSDADYFILAEARDGIALDTAVRIAGKGTRRMKMTFHLRDPLSFASDAAAEIVRRVGGDVADTALRVAASFDYIFHFVNLRRSNAKKLKGIYEIGVMRDEGSSSKDRIYVNEICRYNCENDSWKWTYQISRDKRVIGEEEDPQAFRAFEAGLKDLFKKGALS
ncbi:MAG: CpaF/VirB11 family protein [Clostridiales Family XIII bacterium]|jgi:pilus assembly protein CpaF|nr:CpaF/VirB11 family protein [Clostridiales Family XIII bacterium]